MILIGLSSFGHFYQEMGRRVKNLMKKQIQNNTNTHKQARQDDDTSKQDRRQNNARTQDDTRQRTKPHTTQDPQDNTRRKATLLRKPNTIPNPNPTKPNSNSYPNPNPLATIQCLCRLVCLVWCLLCFGVALFCLVSRRLSLCLFCIGLM